METLSVRVRYRPVRLGWCVRDGSVEDLRRVIHLTHTLWGGRHNPVIPIGNVEAATQLVDVFRVDALYPAADDLQLHRFIERFRYLPWPHFHKELFIDGTVGRIATFLDIYHPVRRLFEKFVKDKDSPKISATLYEWETEDPLAFTLLAYFGSYPTRDDVGKDYATFVAENLKGKRIKLGLGDPVPLDAYKALTPSVLSAYTLEWDRPPSWGDPGLYVGDATDFQDIVNFWNLRAADIELVFYDPRQDGRLRPLVDGYLGRLRERPVGPVGLRVRISVWSKEAASTDGLDFGSDTVRCAIDDVTWNGLNVKPPLMYIDEHSVLASVTESGSVPSLAFQLPKKPFYDEVEMRSQHLVVSVRPVAWITDPATTAFAYPYIPELNEYYGREAHFMWNEARAERDGLGLVTSVTRSQLTLRSLAKRQLVARIFETFGMGCEPSPAGRMAARLIHQMGGIQGCRVFKIAGVRKLIEQYGPLQSFTRGAALQIIGQVDSATGQPNFKDYEDLFIEPRESGKLKPEHAFTYLLKKGVFRVGLNLICPNCELSFWMSLDDVGTEVACDYCGEKFNVTTQLRDRDWAYRRSGLFGREDHQLGSIPVALTLQQLDTVLHPDVLFVTGMGLTPLSAPINPCETDIVLSSQKSHHDSVHLAIGECKAAGEITEDDVANMARVANAFPRKRIEAYVIFSKTSPFTPDEIARCRSAQADDRPRVILLSDRELEPYFVYERTEKEFDIRSSALSLEDLALATHDIYFEPRRRAARAAQ